MYEFEESNFSHKGKSTEKKSKKKTFEHCQKLEEIHIPDSVTQIEKGAFYYCRSLSKLTLGKKLEVIDNNAFEGCSSLKQIEILILWKVSEREHLHIALLLNM